MIPFAYDRIDRRKMNSDENCDVNAQHARQTDDIFGTVCGGWGLIKISRVIRQCAPTAETQEYVKGIVSLFLTLIPVAFPTYFLSLSPRRGPLTVRRPH